MANARPQYTPVRARGIREGASSLRDRRPQRIAAKRLETHPLEVPPPAPARAPPFSDDADAACSALRLPFADEAEWAPAEEEPC